MKLTKQKEANGDIDMDDDVQKDPVKDIFGKTPKPLFNEL
jgi:hypothetical protein